MISSSRTRYLWLACVFVVAAVSYVLSQGIEGQPAYTKKVEQITSSGQSYDGEYVDKLVALGPGAVPAISEALLDPEEQFPSTFILALGRINDPAATKPLLDFLARLDPQRYSEHTAETVRVIDALSTIGHPQAIEPLRQIVQAESAHPRVRLSAAAALARSGEPATSDEGREFIFEIYENRSAFQSQHGREINEAELYSAIAAADSDRSVKILVEVMDSAPYPYVAMPIISYFSKKKTPEATHVLDRVSKGGSDYPLNVRIAALEELLTRDSGISNRVLLDRANEMMAEAHSNGWSQDVIESISSMQSKLQRLP